MKTPGKGTSPGRSDATPKEPDQSVGKIYALADSIADKAHRFIRGIQRGKSSHADDTVRLLAEFDAETWRLLWILGNKDDAGVIFNDPNNTHLEHQIATSRHHRPAILCGAEFTSALRAVIWVSQKTSGVVRESMKPGCIMCGGLITESTLADADVVQKDYLEQFREVGILEAGGWRQAEWLAFCKRCVTALPEFTPRSVQTMLYMEKAGIDKERVQSAVMAILAEAVSGDVVQKPGQPPVVEVQAGQPVDDGNISRTLLAIGDDVAAKVMIVVSKTDLDTEQKLAAISALDERYYAWNSPKLAALLSVSSPMIRQTNWWQVTRKAWIADHRDLSDSVSDD